MPTPLADVSTDCVATPAKSKGRGVVKNLIGQRFSGLCVVSRAGTSPSGNATWDCICDCGGNRTVAGGSLTGGLTKGCVRCAKAKHSNVKNLQGRRFGKLSVVSQLGINRNGLMVWQCACDCGGTRAVVGSRLLDGRAASCERCRIDRLILRVTTHGQTKGYRPSGVYQSWSAMWMRCTNPKSKDWKDYGGRGIKVCEDWKNFENFYAVMGDRPDGLTLDRTDVNGNYEPGNTRWATAEQQAQNHRVRRDNKTGHSCVYTREGRYRAEVTVNHKRILLGYFPLSSEGLKAAVDAVAAAKMREAILS